MSKSNDFYEGENVEELNISQENQKFYEKLMKDLGFSSEKEEKSKSKPIDLEKAYQTINKFQENNTNQKDSLQQQKSNKNLINRINELQNELNLVSKEINDYVETYSENTLFKKESNFNKISEELKLYSSKLNNILNSDLYKNTLIPKKILSSDKNGLKEQIKTNLENYTNSTARLMELISQEKENFMYQKNVDTTTHQMFMNKFFYENNDISNNFEKNILEIEKELTNIENIIGTKKLDMDENLNITQMLNKLFYKLRKIL
jgi:hypothetical protein